MELGLIGEAGRAPLSILKSISPNPGHVAFYILLIRRNMVRPIVPQIPILKNGASNSPL